MPAQTQFETVQITLINLQTARDMFYSENKPIIRPVPANTQLGLLSLKNSRATDLLYWAEDKNVWIYLTSILR